MHRQAQHVVGADGPREPRLLGQPCPLGYPAVRRCGTVRDHRQQDRDAGQDRRDDRQPYGIVTDATRKPNAPNRIAMTTAIR